MKRIELETKEQKKEKEITNSLKDFLDGMKKEFKNGNLFFKTEKEEKDYEMIRGVLEKEEELREKTKENLEKVSVIIMKEKTKMRIDGEEVKKIFGYLIYKKEIIKIKKEDLEKQFKKENGVKYIYEEREF